MKILRSILPLILVVLTTLLVSCGSPSASVPPTYTPEKLQKITTYRIPVDIAQQRLSELGEFISQEDWIDTETFIHGPLGLIRRDLTYLSNALLPKDQEQALELGKDIFEHLEDIDVAAKNKNYTTAINEYKQVVSDFDAYLQLIPNQQENT